ncbi:uncharacterized protein SPSK_01303 [Sporothrix schenckii 1099-18]|uniref:Uncharacterized protein n=1 Tax=Sporothrix schenckii 1099-18 TaxID=1397361 RepID=A0A0F2LX01_SPOSC|nr:uncharacterized protein SPSK_01303 [Sporothrix schenckii 1099-18]KJR81384.1 hypothetical protein SPSK_01303 [Sporothrix schenckii 1099-18]
MLEKHAIISTCRLVDEDGQRGDSGQIAVEKSSFQRDAAHLQSTTRGGQTYSVWRLLWCWWPPERSVGTNADARDASDHQIRAWHIKTTAQIRDLGHADKRKKRTRIWHYEEANGSH